MLFYIFLACLIQGYVIGEEEEEGEICAHLYPTELEVSFIPDADTLPTLCPKLIGYLECETRLLIEEKKEIDPIVFGIQDVVNGICDEDSKFQKDYLSSVDCFKGFENNMPPCQEKAQKMYLDYRLHITKFDSEDSAGADENESDGEEEYKDEPITHKEPYCMMSGYAIGCLGIQILDTCGQTAQDSFIEIIQRSKILTQHCPQQERMKLRSEFLDFLEFEKDHSHIGMFRKIFDFEEKK